MKVIMINERAGVVKKLIGSIIKKGFLKKGYMCGFVNGMKTAMSIVQGNENEISFERNDSLEKSKSEIVVATSDKGKFVILVFDNEGNLEKMEEL